MSDNYKGPCGEHCAVVEMMRARESEIERLRTELAAERDELRVSNDEIIKLTAELSGVRACVKSLNKHIKRAQGNTRVMKAERDAAKLREALEFYASERTYQSSTVYMCGHSGDSKIETDGGRRARAVLAETGGEDE
jgi:hypothetical protein